MKKVLLFFVLLIVQLGYSQTTWTGATNSDWNTGSNWSTGVVPSSSSAVIIPNVSRKPIVSISGAACASLTINNAAGTTNTLTITAPGNLTVSGAIILSAPTANNGLSIINVASGTLSADSITFSDTSGSSRDSRLTIGTGIVTVSGSATMSGAANENEILFSGTGTLNIGNTINGVGTFTAGTGTVNYNNSGAQAIGNYTYNNLTLSGSGTKTFASSALVTSTLSIATGVKAHLGAFIHNSRSINLGGLIATSQTWGSSASTATNKNDVFFESSTGLILIIREINRIYTDYTGFFSSSGTTSVAANQPDTENNLLAFEWNGKTWGTGVDNAVLTSNGIAFEDTKFRALKIFSIDFTPGTTYFLQGAAIDGSLTNRVLTPSLIGIASTPAELAERLTDGKKGLSLGTGIANIKAGTSEFKIGTGNINISGVGDGKPDVIITQVALPNAVADVFKFVDVNGVTIGNPITISFPSINAVGTYRLDLFNAADGSTSNSFTPNETRDIRMLGYDFSDLGINASNEALVDRLVITFSGSSDCAFIGVNEGSLKRSELSLIKTASITDCGKTGDTVTFTFEVKNTGDVPINNIKVKDFNPAVSIPSHNISLLMPGSSATVNGTYVITAADAAIGKIENSAEVEGEDPSLSKIKDISGTNEFNNIPTVINLLDPPTIGAISNVTCVAVTSGSVVLHNLPSTGSWTISSTPTVTGLSGTLGSGTSTTISGLTTGNYTFKVTSASGCISPSSANVPIVDASSTTWNGSSWSNGTPDATKNIIIASSLGSPFAANLSGCYLTINTGVTATVPSGVTLTITNAVTTNGQLIFENNASLVQTTNTTNTGVIEYRRVSSPMKNFDFTYWSSPVTGQTAKLLSPNTLADKYFRFNGNVLVNDWVFDDGVMAPGVGFIIRVPKPGTYGALYPETVVMPYAQPVAFRGVPNNGNYSFGVGANQYNLVGNPYPSALRADDFINANNGIIYGALYFWTHNTAITPSGSDYVYTADDYASYTLSGGTGTGVGNLVSEWVDMNNNQIVDSGEYTELNGNGFLDKLPEWNDLNNNNILESGEWNDVNNNNKLDLPTFEVVAKRPTGFIAAGQSFFVGNAAAGNFQFTNAMRVSGINNQFFKQANTKKTTAIEKNRVWLNLTNSGGAFKQLLVGYITGATNDWDNLYDGPSFDGQEFVDFYSINIGQNLTIQGRALPFATTDEVPLGYRSTIAGDFDISIDTRDGQLATQEIWLEDKKTNTTHELSKGKYTFTAIKGVENNRFVLKYTNKTLGNTENELADKTLIVSVKNKKISLTSSAEAIAKVQVFDLLGRKIYDQANINAQEWTIVNLAYVEQVLLVKTTLTNGAISSKKIIF